MVEGWNWPRLKFWNNEWPELLQFLEERASQGHIICPARLSGYANLTLMFRCLNDTPLSQVRIVIVGHEPYYQKGLADGLAFSVRPNVQSIPAALNNIFIEYKKDLGFKYPLTGDLSPWSRSGVLLMHAVWSVEEEFRLYRERGHSVIEGKRLWDKLTSEILINLSNRKDKLVFILWGKPAEAYRKHIDEEKHLVLVGAHPSNRTRIPIGNLMFPGGKYFSKACDYLGQPYSIWKLP